MQKSATQVQAEDPATQFHSERKGYADLVLLGDASIYEMTIGVCTNPTILANVTPQGDTSAVPDTDIEFTVSSLWNAYSGVGAPTP